MMLKAMSMSAIALVFLGISSPLSAQILPVSTGRILQGEATQIIRAGQTLDVTPGMAIYADDRLVGDAQSNLVVQCQDLSLHPMTAEAIANPCAKQSPKCTRGLLGCPKRSEPMRWSDLDIPYLLSPRNGAVFGVEPLIRWQPVPGASSYRVIVDAPDGAEWVAETNQTQIRYTGPNAERGQEQPYLITITADTGASSETEPMEPDIMTGFWYLTTAQMEAMLLQATPIAELLSSSDELAVLDAVALAQVELYLQFDLVSPAIERLEGLIVRGKDTAALNLLLGDLYFYRAGLAPAAIAPYQRSLELMAAENHHDRGRAQVGLIQAYDAIAQFDQAEQWVTPALETYTMLGNVEMVDWLTKYTVSLPE